MLFGASRLLTQWACLCDPTWEEGWVQNVRLTSPSRSRQPFVSRLVLSHSRVERHFFFALILHPIEFIMQSRAGSWSSQSCEGGVCDGNGQPTYFCVHCDSNFCDGCWRAQVQHRPGKRGPDGLPHEKTDLRVVSRLRNILEPSLDPHAQRALHRVDEDTTWFGIGRNGSNDPVFQDYGRYATIMADSLPSERLSRYPQLVSFIGQTGDSFPS